MTHNINQKSRVIILAVFAFCRNYSQTDVILKWTENDLQYKHLQLLLPDKYKVFIYAQLFACK